MKNKRDNKEHISNQTTLETLDEESEDSFVVLYGDNSRKEASESKGQSKQKNYADKLDKEQSKEKKKKKKSHGWMWPIAAFFITLALSAIFSLTSNVIISVSTLAIVLVVIVVLLSISIVFDAIGVAFASCDPMPFFSMASKKERGAKMSLSLLKKADRVSSICNDIIGDICGIISGACGASVILKLALDGARTELLVSVLVGSLISAFTVGGKAAAKRFAITHSRAIVLGVGKVLSIFSKSK